MSGTDFDVAGALGDRVKVRRRSSFVVDLVAASANPSIDRQPARSGFLRVFVDTPVAGTVLLGNGPVESIVFSAGDQKKLQSTNLYAALAGLTLQGLAGATLSIEVIQPTGEPILGEYTVTASVPCKWMVLSPNRIRFTRQAAGQIPEGQFRIITAWNADIQPGDVVLPVSGSMFGLTMAEVIGIYGPGDFDGITHHLEVDLRRI